MKRLVFGAGLARGLLLLCLLFVSISLQAADARQGLALASWNIKRLGHGSSTDFTALGSLAAAFDFIAVQEVMTPEGLENLDAALEAATGEDWQYLASHRVGRSSYKEIYAFLWRSERVAYMDGAVVYLDPGDLFAREPYSARFRDLTRDQVFAAATVHIVYGDRVSDRTEEIDELTSYWRWLEDIYPQTPLLLMGDFNLEPDHPAWQPLLSLGVEPQFTSGATTLSSRNGRYANLYDNIWMRDPQALGVREAGILRFPELLGWDHERARREVSDHAPVYLLTGNAELAGVDQERLSRLSRNQEQLEASDELPLGNRRSKILHRPDCPSYSRVGEQNRVYFDSVEAGLEAGYRLAGNCP
ncbi:endonuclease/exonuclease/phosphatase family protein [Marinospirillum perlucidum]|uniref:endonuclease/exonuclease/phosphatase family protein n=1 Tax=Marinospirillum perlucidum TaxID=1982602 RepID=UPI001C498608|nr:endonuclease/exonuclease/phosphatase family protein [Marinospirillum perlucidum]